MSMEQQPPQIGRPPGTAFPERWDAVLAMKLEGIRNRDIQRDLSLTRHQVSGLVMRLRESGDLPRVVPKVSRPRKNPIYKKPKAATPRPASWFTRGYRPRRDPTVTIPPPDTVFATLELRTGCAWPVNDGKPFLFCDAPTEGSPYCPHHRQRMYTQSRAES